MSFETKHGENLAVMSGNNLLSFSPKQFVLFLREHRIRRCHFVHDPESGAVHTSHPLLQPLADFLRSDKRDFMQHEGLFLQVTRQLDILQGAFVHKTVRGVGAGGLRFWHYETVEEFLRDGLRLSKGMTRKNALAGLWWGGGKGVMADNPAVDKRDPAVRQSIFKEYGELMSALRGCYVTAEDVGTKVPDIANIFSQTRFATCIPPEMGGSGNPSIPTAKGVVRAIEAAVRFVLDQPLAGRTVAVQGLGNVGGALVGFLFEQKVARVVASDIDAENIEAARKRFAASDFEARLVQMGDTSILTTECDVLAPCATGAILNPRTIPEIKAPIVCGAANNQLEDTERDDMLLQQQGIVYVPDFLANRMGIVNCANEQYGTLENDPVIEQHLSAAWQHSVYQTTLRVLKQSRETGEAPAKVAVRLADEMSEVAHPIFGHRGQQIIDSLVARKWFRNDLV